MPDITDKLVVITITKDEARVWATGLQRGMNPTKIFAPPALIVACLFQQIRVLFRQVQGM